MELQSRLEAIRASGPGVAAISFDSQDVLAAFSERRGITFPLLSDQGSATIKRFGILNTVAEEGLGPNADDPAVQADVNHYVSVFGALPMIVGTPFPGTFIVEPKGRVTSRFFEEFYAERNTASNIMLRLGSGTNPTAGTQGSTAHVSITASQSNPEISAGSKFSIVLDIEPRPNIHVCAPGAEDFGYRVVAFNLEQESFVRALPLQYPPSQIYHFEPLDARVPVYQAPFRIVQEIVLNASRDVAEAFRDDAVLTLTSTFDYQACNDAVCFDPVSVPLSWTVAVAPLDRQRAQSPPDRGSVPTAQSYRCRRASSDIHRKSKNALAEYLAGSGLPSVVNKTLAPGRHPIAPHTQPTWARPAPSAWHRTCHDRRHGAPLPRGSSHLADRHRRTVQRRRAARSLVAD